MTDRRSLPSRRAVVGGMTAFATAGAGSRALAHHKLGHDDLRVGLVAPLSGPGAVSGTQTRQDIELAVEVAPELYKGDLSGLKVSITTKDTAGDAGKVKDAVVDLSKEEPIGLISVGINPQSALQGAATAREAGVPVLEAFSSAPFSRPSNWAFRLSLTERLIVDQTMSYLKEIGATQNVPVRRIALSRFANAAEFIRPQFETALKRDYQVVHDGPDLAAGDGQSVASEADAWIVPFLPPSGLPQLLRAIQRPHPRITIVGVPSSFLPELAKAGGVGKTLFSVWYSPDLGEKRAFARDIAERYQKKFNAPPTAAALLGFTAADTLIRASIQAGAARRAAAPQAVRDGLEKIEVPGERIALPWQIIRFDKETGDNVGARIVLTQVVKEKPATVWPLDVATEKISL